MSFQSRLHPRLLLPVVLAAAGALVAMRLVPAEAAAVEQQLNGFPDSYIPAHQARPLVIGLLCLMPALASFGYCFGNTLDRYVTRQFTKVFALCLAALLAIWLLIDLGDNIGDFRNTGHLTSSMLKYYTTKAPAVFLLLLPYSLLLSLLYSLGRLSMTREIVAMIQSGRSVVRITAPLMFAGLLFSLVSMGLNYHWAPSADRKLSDIVPDADGNDSEAKNVLYRDPDQHRLWSIGAFPRNYQMGQPLRNVEITTTRDDKTLESRLTAKRAFWDRATHEWTFEDPVLGNFEEGRPATFQPFQGNLKVSGWPETPWQLIKPGLSAAALGIPDLETWLRANSHHSRFAEPAPYLTQWHYRWALPMTCLITVLISIPLAVHFARRGSSGSVVLAIILSGLLLLVTSISMALGESGAIPPMYAAWMPNLAFAVLALYLFHRRLTGQPIYLVLRRLFPDND